MIPSSIVLFVCEHGAAKSILAAACFNKLAEEKGLHIRALARGTHPDSDLSPETVNGLQADGLTPPDLRPIKISTADLKGIDRIVTFCELPAEFRSNIKVENWQGVPAVSEDYARARDNILLRLHGLFDQIEREA